MSSENRLMMKIAAVVAESEHLDHHGKARRVKLLIDAELELRKEDRFFSEQDLAHIQDRAVRVFKGAQMTMSSGHYDTLTYAQNPELFRAFCTAQATIEYLRSMDLLTHSVIFQKKKLPLPFCRHAPGVDSRCTKCRQPLKRVETVEYIVDTAG